MLSRQDAIDLLKESKIILNLYSENDDKLKFKLQITQSNKIEFKLSNHHQFNNIGLLRLDYNGRHINPMTITEQVPEILHKYVGKFFGIDEHHIHIYVENYGLNWALPLNEYGFPIKKISSQGDVVSAIKGFQKEINLKTELIFPFSLFVV
ncbi:MAG: hypothetical protein SWO11_18550 [Thermodesulfobacteriota bacterium]|nr:hypothetical protein [Thermodesulfobacteriota bacterium]